MRRHHLRSLIILVLSVPSALFFVLFPQWQIEHPGDPGLVLRSERHFLWHAPAAHAHLDPASMWIPVLAIGIIASALIVLAFNAE
jgi:hypothetical protein